jgi:hypothetical protein
MGNEKGGRFEATREEQRLPFSHAASGSLSCSYQTESKPQQELCHQHGETACILGVPDALASFLLIWLVSVYKNNIMKRIIERMALLSIRKLKILFDFQ